MRVLVVEPGKRPVEQEIDGSLESMQAIVGGTIQAIYPFEDFVALICNDEAKLIGMKGNRRYGKRGVIAGPFFICGCNLGEYRSLTDDEVKYYLEKFKEPEEISDEETQADTGFQFITF